nr:D-alanine--D-alanine ligase [Angustibacter aerolatus]
MDKHVMKVLLAAAGLPVGPYEVVLPRQWDADPAAVLDRLAGLGLPVFVKPARAGSSMGITRVDDAARLTEAIEAARAHDPKVVVEAGIEGREARVRCAAGPRRHPAGQRAGEIEVVGDHDFYDFEAKYLAGDDVRLTTPADVPADVRQRVQQVAVEAFEAIGCEGLARVDVFWTTAGEVVVNEINTMPGFTEHSMYPRMWAASGVDYPALVDRLLQPGPHPAHRPAIVALVVPDQRGDAPALAGAQQAQRLRPSAGVPRAAGGPLLRVGAPVLGEVAEHVGAALDLPLAEAGERAAGQQRATRLDETLHVVDRRAGAVEPHDRGPGHEQRGQPVEPRVEVGAGGERVEEGVDQPAAPPRRRSLGALPGLRQAAHDGREVGQHQRFGVSRDARHQHLDGGGAAVGGERAAVAQRAAHPVHAVDADALVGGRARVGHAAAPDHAVTTPRGDGGGVGRRRRAGPVAHRGGQRPGRLRADRVGPAVRHRDVDRPPAPPGEGGRQRHHQHQAEARGDDAGQTWTTVHVRVRVMPGTSWMRAMTSRPSSSTVLASTRAITS